MFKYLNNITICNHRVDNPTKRGETMATANIPYTGPAHDAAIRRERMKIAAVDPVERYRLREEDTSRGLRSAANALVRQAQKNHITQDTITGRVKRW